MTVRLRFAIFAPRDIIPQIRRRVRKRRVTQTEVQDFRGAQVDDSESLWEV